MNNFFESYKIKSDLVIVFAGVFDPVHIGHISAAEEVMKRYGKEVVFLPERVPQHKHSAISYEHRLAMLKIALSQYANMYALDYPEPKHYIQPIFKWLSIQYPNREFLWLLGSDVLPHVESWPGIDNLKELRVNRIVTIERSTNSLSKDRKYKNVAGINVEHMRRKRKKHSTISSSWIREYISRRHTSLTDGVYEYIKSNNLYKK